MLSDTLPPLQSHFAGRRNVGKTIMANPNAIMALTKKDTLSAEEILGEQFRYFRKEFMEATISLGVAVPLDILEDKSGHLFSFVKNGGPKYLLQVVQSNMESVHLMRCALSLLILTATILRRKLPDANFTASSDTIANWAMDELNKISDAGAVSACVTILVSSFNPCVQELSLSLLNTILSVSEEAKSQLLMPVTTNNAQTSDVKERTLSFNARSMNNTGSRPGTSDSSKSERGTKRASTLDFTKFSLRINKNDNALGGRRAASSQGNRARADSKDSPSCLSYILSAILVQKNRHLLMAGLADVVTALTRSANADVCELTATMPTSEAFYYNHGLNKSSQQKSSSKLNYSASVISNSSAPGPNSPGHGNTPESAIIEWAGLKLLLKFLFRYHKLNAQAKSNSICRDSVSASLHLKDEYVFTHTKVFLAACSLIRGSTIVASELIKLNGAEDLLRVSADTYHNHLAHYLAAAGGGDGFIENHRPGSGNNMHLSHSASHGSSHEPDDDIIATCFQNIAFAKERYRSLQALLSPAPYDRRARTAAGGSGNNTANNTAPSSKTKNSVLAANRGNSLSPQRMGSAPRPEKHMQPIQLSNTMNVEFSANYDVETEKGKLYLMNSADGSYDRDKKTFQPGSSLQKQFRAEKKEKALQPLNYDTSFDALLDNSLQSIEHATKTNLGLASPTAAEADSRLANIQEEGLMQGSSAYASTFEDPDDSTPLYGNNVRQKTASQHSASQSRLSHILSDTPPLYLQSLPKNDYHSTMNASRDFFGRMPHQPLIPIRIEAREVIDKTEDLSRIRERYKEMANNAVWKLTNQVGYTKNGKNSISIEERCRRVYSPKKHKTPKALSKSLSAPATMEGEASFGFNAGGAEAEAGMFEGVSPLPLYASNNEDEDERPFTSIQGLKLESTLQMDEDNLFENFRPIFDYPVAAPPPLAPPTAADNSAADGANKPAGYSSKLKVEMLPSIDLILS